MGLAIGPLKLSAARRQRLLVLPTQPRDGITYP
jgi:hypothetical protein